MSFKATNWALTVKGLKPATKIVLIYLSDRHNPDYGCFPSVARLAVDCEMSERSVHYHIDELERRGLVSRRQRTKANGIKTSNDYTLHMSENPDLQNLQNGTAKSAVSDLQNLQSNLVSNNHVKDNLKNMAIFDDLWKMYPKKVGKGQARKAYSSALRKVDHDKIHLALIEYVRSTQNDDKKYLPHLSTWLNGERWDDEVQEKSLQEMTSEQQIQEILNSYPTERKLIQ
ncbi:MAG: hypothetical protein CMJ25_15300 [Phycisphaerae bacterium]|nr:hypothetical protein [Phycisphaerae bacterium]